MKRFNYKHLKTIKPLWYCNASHIVILLLCISMAVISCTKELDSPDVPPLETGMLSASKSVVVIDNTKPFDEAVTFSWDVAKNSHVEYKLVLTSGTKSDTVDVLTEVSKKFSNVDFNIILIDKLQLEIGKTTNVDVVVYSKVVGIADNSKTASSTPVTISVTPDNKVEPPPLYAKLWIVGNATPNGWNIDGPNEMVSDPTNSYQFKYNEVLNAGEFKIPTATGNWNGDFYMPPTDHPPLSSTDVKLIPGGNPDNKWQIATGGAYKILLNISSNPFINIKAFTPFDNIYIMGDAVEGTDIDHPSAMTADANDPNVFTWVGDLSSTGDGGFRFPVTVGNASGIFFVAPSVDAAVTAKQLTYTSDGTLTNNFKVKVGEEGVYKITLNQLKETISIVKQ